jgi:signal transduction histidine kinase/CheY-like chemotaxis protein
MIRMRVGRRHLNVRHFLVAVGVLCSIGIVAGTLLLLDRGRQGDLQAEDERGRLLASVLESHVSRTLSSVDNSLNAISRVLLLPSGRSGVGPGGVDVQALLETLASSSTYLRSVSVLDAGGRVISSSNRQNIGRRFSPAQLGFGNEIGNSLENGRPLFVRDLHELDDMTDAGTATAAGHAERGVYVLPFATLIRVDGTNLRLLALVNPAYLFPDHRTGPRDEVGYEVLFDYQGMVLAATPEAPFAIGSRHARLPLFELLNSDNEYGRFGLARKDSAAAAGNYMVNFRASRSFPLVAVVALSEERVLADWQDGAWRLKAIGFAAALLALLYAAALHRTMGAGERTREELRKARDAAEKANAAKSVFLSTMSHEIRTPMNGVLGMAALLRDTPLNAQQQEFARTISDSGEALLSIINDILDFSKIEAGHMDIDLVDCALLPLAEGCIDTLASRAASRGLVLASFIDPALPAIVRADGGRLRQVLLNLLDNAIKFTPSGEVTLRVTLAGQANGLCRVDFEVIDSGIGIGDQTLARLFQPFVQADSSVTRTYGGTGLGLSICKRLLELMGSRIEVDSRPGLGSTFRFRLELNVAAPPAPAQPLPPGEVRVLTPPAASGPAPAPDPSCLVLLVEDNLINQKVALHQLGRLGYASHVASNGAEALKALALRDYALVLMDCQMPLLDGFEATRRIRDAERASGGRRLPIIAMTANAAEGDRERCLAAGMDDYLSKPIVRETLAALLRQYIAPTAQAVAAPGASMRTGTDAASGGGALRCE